MKKIYESQLNGWDESAERICVYALENDDEYWEINEMTHEEKCEYFDVFDQAGYFIMPGVTYHTYDFHLYSNHVVIVEHFAYNV